MTQFSPIRGTSTQINNTPVVDGQLLFEVSNLSGQNHIYIDIKTDYDDEIRVPLGISEWSQVQHKPFETIGSGLSVNNNVLSADDQTWNQIGNKPFETIGSGLTVVDGVLDTNVSTPKWSEIDNRPFSSIGVGLTVDSNNRLNANIRSVQLTTQGTGTASSPQYQQLAVNDSGTTTNSEIDGTKFMEYSQNLSTSDSTVYTFSSSEITANSAIDVFTSIWGIDPTNVSASNGTCTVTFAPVETATSMICRIYIK